ncbi:MAG: caspase family protein [Bauldia sp.]|nr:caspase family protein [Bauldia sp.]
MTAWKLQFYLWLLSLSLSLGSPAMTEEVFVRVESDGLSSDTYKMYDESHALIIGVADYENPSWPHLSAVKAEVDMVRTELERQNIDTSTVLNPSSSELLTTIKQFLLKKRKRNSRLIVYFAGHGYSDSQLTGYILGRDAPPEEDDDFISTVLSMEDVSAWARKSKVKHILLVFNSCFSGAIFASRSKSDGPLPRLFLNDLDRDGRAVITAGNETDQVPDNLVFAQAFVSGLQGDADRNGDGVVTGRELGSWVRDVIFESPGNNQTPFVGDLGLIYRAGDILFPTGTVRDEHVLPVALNPDGRSGPRVAALRSLGSAYDSEASVFSGIDIVYYSKIADRESVRSALDNAEVTYTETRAGLPDKFRVNAIACGPDVPVEAITKLALTLIEQGVPIRGLIRFRRPAEKPMRLELLTLTENGAGEVPLSSPQLTREQLRSITECPSYLTN